MATKTAAEKINVEELLTRHRALAEREADLKATRRRSKEAGHRQIDELVAAARAALVERVEGIRHMAAASSPTIPAGFGDLWLFANSTELHEQLHAAIATSELSDQYGWFTAETDEAFGELRAIADELESINAKLAQHEAAEAVKAAKVRLEELTKGEEQGMTTDAEREARGREFGLSGDQVRAAELSGMGLADYAALAKLYETGHRRSLVDLEGVRAEASAQAEAREEAAKQLRIEQAKRDLRDGAA